MSYPDHAPGGADSRAAVTPAPPGWPAADAPSPAPGPPTRPRVLSGGMITALVLAVIVTIVLGAFTIGGSFLLFTGRVNLISPLLDDGSVTPYPGTVTDGAGAPQSTGTYEAPARVGEDRLTWDVDGGGRVTIVVDSVDWDGGPEVATADPAAPEPAPENRFVLVTLTGTYEGPGFMILQDQVWLSVDTDQGSYVAEGTSVRAPAPLWRRPGLGDGESETDQVVIEVPEDELGSALVSVSTTMGDWLYVSDR